MRVGTKIWFKDSEGGIWIGFVNNPKVKDLINVTAIDNHTGGRLKRFNLRPDEIIKSSYNNQGPDILYRDI